MTRSLPEAWAASADWRADILSGVLRVMFAVGVIAAGVSVGYSLAVGEWAIAVVDAIAIALLGVLTHAPWLSYRQRSTGLLALLYGLGVFLLFTVGLASHIYLLAFAVFASLLLGLRAALVAVGITTVTLVALAVRADAGPTVTMGDLGTTGARLVVITNFVFVGTVLVVACATLLRRVERALEEQERARRDAQRLARAVEQSSDVILLADPSGRVEYSNRAHRVLVERLGDTAGFEHLDQFLAGAAIGDAPTDVARREGLWSGALVLTGGSLASNEHTIIEFDASIEAIHDTEGKVVNLVGSLYDITAARSFERRLRRSEKLEALGTLASGIAHDFNNVITVILSVAAQLAQHLDDEEHRSDAEVIMVTCERARDVVQQMMVFGDRTSADQSLIIVADAVRETRPMLRAAIGAEIEIVEDLQSSGVVLAHQGSLSQVVVNLVTNAAHAIASGSGSGSGSGTITIRVADVIADPDLAATHPLLVIGNPYVILSVTDDGTGIDPAHIDQIFDPFYTTKNPGEGTGLGLASVHGIVTAAGGEIGVYSEVGIGTTFRILLPALVDSDRQRPAQKVVPINRATRPQPLTVLLVDDEPMIVVMLARGLEHAGHVVHRAADGLAARELFDANPNGFDVLVTDLTMPGIGGIDLIHHVRSVRDDLPIVLTSGFGHDRSGEALATLRLAAYLVKPFSHTDLLEVLEHINAVRE